MKRRRYIIGKGLSDWIQPVVRAIGGVGKFVAANKGTIANVADVAGKVAKAGATTASSIKQIADIVRSKARSSTRTAIDGTSGPEKVLSEKTMELLRGFVVPPTGAAASSGRPPDGYKPRAAMEKASRSEAYQNINSRIAGSGFKKILY